MSADVLFGSRRWTIAAGYPGFDEQFDAAVQVLCAYAQDAIRLQSRPNIRSAAAAYFAGLPFASLGDIYGAVTVVGTTPRDLLRPTFRHFLEFVPPEWANNEGLSQLFEMIHGNALTEQLRRVFRSPTTFARSDQFDQELGRRAMELSLPATPIAGKVTADLISEALRELVEDHERSKWDPEFAVQLGRIIAWGQSASFGRREAKHITKLFRRGQWTPELQQMYDVHSQGLNEQVSYIVNYAHFMGWNTVKHPELHGRR